MVCFSPKYIITQGDFILSLLQKQVDNYILALVLKGCKTLKVY